MKRKLLLAFQLTALLILNCSAFATTISPYRAIVIRGTIDSNARTLFIRGVAFTCFGQNGYGSPDADVSLDELIRTIGPNWVAIPVVWFMPDKYATVIQSGNTVSDSSLIRITDAIHAAGSKVMIELLVDSLDGARQGIQPTDWHLWFESYRAYANRYAEFSLDENVDMLCVGAELTSSVVYDAEWREVIRQVRQIYKGPLTYGANHDSTYSVGNAEWERITWWDALDYAGIDAYFSLTQKTDPTLAELESAWIYWRTRIGNWQGEHNKPVIFNEGGFRSEDGGNIGLLQPKTGIYDPQEQVDIYSAYFNVFKGISWYYGAFWWCWSYNPNAGGLNDTTILLNNKPAAALLGQWYSPNVQ